MLQQNDRKNKKAGIESLTQDERDMFNKAKKVSELTLRECTIKNATSKIIRGLGEMKIVKLEHKFKITKVIELAYMDDGYLELNCVKFAAGDSNKSRRKQHRENPQKSALGIYRTQAREFIERYIAADSNLKANEILEKKKGIEGRNRAKEKEIGLVVADQPQQESRVAPPHTNA